MKKKNLCLAIVCITAVFLSAACGNAFGNKKKDNQENTPTPTPTPTPEDTTSKVSFDNFKPRSILVKNNTGERLIAFKGEINPSQLISGVPAYASNHGLRMDDELFSSSGDFALLFLKEEVYNKNKNNLAAVKNKPFASIYAFYNKKAPNDITFTINGIPSGNAKLILQNGSPFNIEIRCNSPQGEVLGYIGAYTSNTILNVDADDYAFFPILKKYVERDQQVHEIVPRFSDQQGVYFRDFALAEGTETSWNIGALWDPAKMQLSSGGFYLTINNQAETAVSFLKGDQQFRSSATGRRGIPSGSQVTFFVPFERVEGKWYPNEVEFSTLKIGSSQHPKTLPATTFKLDTRYSIKVTGDDAKGLTLDSIQEIGPVDINKLLGM